jgi:(4-(4-[2-(gamma-L-glutamylamino)ethyl]phenoxymethyl)furan-2-yl)methanamine synthase
MNVTGWDIGGVHLKAARVEDDRVVDPVQLAAPLRAGLEPLVRAFEEVKARMGRADCHAITMTAELADTFASRADGVERVAALAARALPGWVALYAGRAGFIPLDAASRHVSDIASANWHASAALVARRRTNALFIDIGSTTTDIVPVAEGKIAARGYTDAERLASGELVYTGLVRGFVMATAPRAPFRGTWTPLVNENFANLADVYRILGTLPADADQMATADGREKTVEASRARLARMVGADAADAADADWKSLARWFAEAQTRAIVDAAMLVLSCGRVPPSAAVVGAGVGMDLIVEIARRVGRDYVPFETLLHVAPQARGTASQCAPATALALLAAATMSRLELSSAAK